MEWLLLSDWIRAADSQSKDPSIRVWSSTIIDLLWIPLTHTTRAPARSSWAAASSAAGFPDWPSLFHWRSV